MRFIRALNRRLNTISMQIAGFFLLAMIVISCGNIFLRIVWMPIKGAYELLGFFSALVAGMALGNAQMAKAHTSVDILISRFPAWLRRIMDIINHSLCCIFFLFAGWQVLNLANRLRISGELTETLRIVYYPFTYGVGVGCFLLALVMFVEFLTLFDKEKGER